MGSSRSGSETGWWRRRVGSDSRRIRKCFQRCSRPSRDSERGEGYVCVCRSGALPLGARAPFHHALQPTRYRIYHPLQWGVPSFCRSYRDRDHESPAGPEGLEGPTESGHPQGQDVEKTRRLPAHARAFESTLNDMLARALHRSGPHGQPTLPGLLVLDPGPVPRDIADQLGQRLADGLFPRPHALQRTQHIAAAVREQRSGFFVHPGLGVAPH